MRFLIFSDIHGDYKALENLMAIDADYYFAAGDLVNFWSRNLDRVGNLLAKRAERMYVLPGNHESEEDIARLCGDFHLNAFHGATLQAGEYHVAGLGYSNPTPFHTPGEYTEAELSNRLAKFASFEKLILICTVLLSTRCLIVFGREFTRGVAQFGSLSKRSNLTTFSAGTFMKRLVLRPL